MSLNNEDIKQLIAILQRGLTDDNNTETEPKDKPQKKRKKTVDTESKNDTIQDDSVLKDKKVRKVAINKFYEMPEFNLHKEDTAFDKKVKKFPPTPRNRSFNYVKVKCRLCGKEEDVSPSLVESIERYKCNKCCTMSG
jgi:hypothetical protein